MNLLSVSLVLLCSCVSVSYATCPSPWKEYNDTCYFFSNNRYRLNDALFVCTSRNSTIFVPDTQDEHDFVVTNIERGTRILYWIGLRVINATWTWLDGAPYDVNSTHWYRNHAGRTNDARSGCAALYSYKPYLGQVQQRRCIDSWGVVCEKPNDAIDVCNSGDNWHMVGDECFKLFDQRANWFDARRVCQQNGGDLFMPTNFKMTYSIGDLNQCRTPDGASWIGVTDTLRPGTFTLASNQTLHYQAWYSYGRVILKRGGTCVYANPVANYVWEAELCTVEKKFICARPQGTCPDGWIGNSEQCYQVNVIPASQTTWFAAKVFCENQNTKLLTIDSAKEDAFLQSSLTGLMVQSIWLGLSDVNSSNTYQWINGTSVSMGYHNWDSGFPQHHDPKISNCGIVQIGASSSAWSNAYCFNFLPFVCKSDLMRTIITNPPVTATQHCDPGWMLFRNHCYLFQHQDINNGYSFTAAHHSCVNMSAELTSITDAYEQSFITVNQAQIGTAWIGLQYRATTNHIVQIVDNAKIKFQSFYPGEPDGIDDGEWCIRILAGRQDYTGSWDDSNCTDKHDFICKKAALSGLSSMTTSAPTTAFGWSYKCGPDWIYDSLDDYCYQIFPDHPKTWPDAQWDCNRRGGNLTSITGPREQNFLQAILSSRRYSNNFWIGATDGNVEGGWEWIDNSPFAFFNWYAGEPNEAGIGEDCVEMAPVWGYQWNDKRCDQPNPYICKKLAAPTRTTPGSATQSPRETCVVQAMISGNYSLLDPYALTAFTTRTANNAPQNSRYYTGSRGGWSSLNTSPGQYIMAGFYNTVIMKGVTTVGRSDADEWVASYKLQFQYDYYSEWVWYEEPPGTVKIFKGNTDSSTPVTNTIHFPPEAKGVKLFPISWHNGMSLRWEILGCIQQFCTPDYAVSGPIVVPDPAISASSISDRAHSAQAGRLHSITTNGVTSSWRSRVADNNQQWLQVDLGTSVIVRGVTIAGNPNAQEWVTQFKFLYNLNGPHQSFNYYQEPYGQVKNIPGNTNNTGLVTYFFKGQFTARFVRVVPVTFHGAIALRMDILVCSFGCSGQPLISGKNKMHDDRLAASSQLDAEHGPSRSRLNVPAMGRYGGAWTAKYNDIHQYIQADFQTMIQVVSVSTQGRQDQAEWVTSYNISYSQDGHVWYSYNAYQPHTVTFTGNWDQNTVRKHNLRFPVMARLIRLWPVASHRRISLRWEVYGCPGPDSGIQIGCYADDPQHRDLIFEPYTDPSVGMWPPMCIHHCFNKGYYYAGLQNQYECFCGNTYGRYGPTNDCTMRCFPKTNTKCGGPTSNLIFSTGLTPEYKVCPPQWTAYEDKCYFPILSTTTWYVARHECNMMGGDLATINSQAVQDLVFSLLSSKRGQTMWIGLNDQVEEAVFEWSAGEQVRYTNWNVNQPRSPVNTDQDCVSISNTTGGWQDDECHSQRQYMCMSLKHATNQPTTAQPVTGCNPGWIAYKWSCYLVVDMPRTFASAHQICRTRYATLVKIEDRYEQSFLSTNLASKSGQYWTDVSDLASPGTFRYSDGYPYLLYANWGPNRPANTSRCAAMQAGGANNGLWFDVSCYATAKSVCEQTRQGYTTPTRPPSTTGVVSCPSGWSTGAQDPNYCYQANIRPGGHGMTYPDAQKDCHAQGANLAAFHNNTSYELLWSKQMSGSSNFWIGLKYSHSVNGGRVFQWEDHSVLDYINWNPHEPNNFHNAENCVEAISMSGKWNDSPCSLHKNWICAIPRGTTPMPRVTLPTPPAALHNCNHAGYVRFPTNSHCYLFVEGVGNQRITWRAAQAVCQGNGGELASIGSIMEQRFIEFQIYNMTSAMFWIGFNEVDSPTGYHWSDGSPATFLNWDSNEPNDYGGAEDCTIMNGNNGKWVDIHCALKSGYVCENGPVPSPTTTPAPIHGNCPSGYYPYGNKCFRVYSALKTWQNASKFCQSLGGMQQRYNLASIANKYENAFVTTLLGNRGGTPWIGLQFINYQMQWIDNTEVTYSNWDKGEPNGRRGNNFCTRIYGFQHNAGLWDDYGCNTTNAFICETKKSPTIMTPEPTPNSCLIHPGFKPFLSDCFMYVSTKMTWANANRYCQTKGRQVFLTTISSIFEESFFFLLINDPSIAHPSGVWTGLNSAQRNSTFTWVDSKWPVLYTNWGRGQPARLVTSGQQCVSSSLDGSWSIIPCTFTLPFVCKLNTASPPVSPPAPNGQCPDAGWLPQVNGTKCYLYRLMDTKTFLDATLFCNRHHGNLISIHSIRDNIQLKSSIQSISVQVDEVWMGLHKYSSSGFQWADASPVSFVYWDHGEPSGHGQRGNAEDCVALRTWNGKWNDVGCELKRGYICEKNKVADFNPITIPAGGAPNTSATLSTKALTPTPGHQGQTSGKVVTPNHTPAGQSSPRVATPTKGGVTNPTHHRITPVPSGNPFTQKQGQGTPNNNNSSGLGAGGIAGVVIGSVVIVLLAVGIVLLWRCKQQNVTDTAGSSGLGFDNSVYQYDSKEEHGSFTNSSSMSDVTSDT